MLSLSLISVDNWVELDRHCDNRSDPVLTAMTVALLLHYSERGLISVILSYLPSRRGDSYLAFKIDGC